MISNRDLEDAIHWSGMTKSDHDAFSALFKNYFNDLHNFGKLFTNENELIGEVASGGFSSKVSFFDHLLEESTIRIDNHQNIIVVILIFINALIKKIIKIKYI
mgnify:CR=1 FL=1